jgi:hypothetical protein
VDAKSIKLLLGWLAQCEREGLVVNEIKIDIDAVENKLLESAITDHGVLSGDPMFSHVMQAEECLRLGHSLVPPDASCPK